MCILTMQSMTQALKAKNVLEAHGVRVTIVNLDPNLTDKGCAYGIRFLCGLESKVKGILNAKNIPYGILMGAQDH